MSVDGILERWRTVLNRLAQEEAWKADDPEVPPFFLHSFRPSGEGLEDVFRGVAQGEEILERLMEVYRIAGEGDGMYFQVRKPAVASRSQLVSLAEQHLARMTEIVREYPAKGWQDVLAPLVERKIQVDVVQAQDPDKGRSEDLNAALYEVTCDYVRRLEAAPSDALLLRNALYYIACRYDLAHHVLWPLYRSATPVREPFQPSYQLWTLGAELWFEEPNLCRVYSPAGSA